jgi:hypothetical protein
VSRRRSRKAIGQAQSDRIVAASWAGTAALTVTAVGAAITPALKVPAFIVAVAMFAVGTGLFVAALVVAAGRSRRDEIGMGGLFFLQGAAPRGVQLHLLGSLVAQSLVALVTAAARPYTSLAFGILAPVYGLGLVGLWAARHGTFASRDEVRRPGPRP